MKTFVYAYVNFFDNAPMIKTVQAEDVMDACKKIFLECCPANEDYDSAEQMDDLMMLQTPEDFVQYLCDGDIGISIPTPISEL